MRPAQGLAAAGKLGMSDLSGGAFSISNIGNLGGTYTKPIINIPEVQLHASTIYSI